VLTEIWRRRAVHWPAQGAVALFLEKGLPNPDFARKVLGWQHSGFSIEKGRIRRYSSLDFIAQVTLHIPPRGRHLVRR
jgi:hypothetical protein